MHSCVGGEKWGLLDAPQFVTTFGRPVGRSEVHSEAHYIVSTLHCGPLHPTIAHRVSLYGGGF